MDSPLNSEPKPPKKVKASLTTPASILLSVRKAFPVSREVRLASSSACCLIKIPHLKSQTRCRM